MRAPRPAEKSRGPGTCVALAAGVALALGLIGVAHPAPARASSIFFLRESNIWAANADGSGQKQLTREGTSTYPFAAIASAKVGATPLVAFMQFTPTYWKYGTINPDGSGLTVNPDVANMPGFEQGNDHDVSIDAAGDKLAWSRDYGSGADPESVGVDGSGQLQIPDTSAFDTTFGDPGGATLLFDDNAGVDYGDGNTKAKGWQAAPSACTSLSHAASDLVRAVGVPEKELQPAPISYYCETENTDLLEPDLSASGQMIAVEASKSPKIGGEPELPNANFTQGQPRIAVFALGAVAEGSKPTPLTFLTPDGLSATHPDFSPDGSEIAFSGPSGVFVVPVAGGAPREVIANATDPAWSPYTLPGAAPTIGPGPTVIAGVSAPSFRALSLRAHTVRAKNGLALRVALSAAGTVVVEFELITHHHGHRLLKSIGTVSLKGKPGANSFTIKRVHGHALAPGSYELALYVKSGAGRSSTRTLALTVKH